MNEFRTIWGLMLGILPAGNPPLVGWVAKRDDLPFTARPVAQTLDGGSRDRADDGLPRKLLIVEDTAT